MRRVEGGNPTGAPAAPESDSELTPAEREILQQVVRVLRGLRYGSVVLTVHDGHVVEIQKTERIRKGAPKKV